MKSITVCVDYADILALTLPTNSKLFEKTVVVTTPDDVKTAELVSKFDNVELFQTSVFYEFGCTFNKGLAIELGFDKLGRDGWMVVWDADMLFPESINRLPQTIGYLTGIKRKLANNKEQFNFLFQKDRPFYPESGEIPGFFQMFHADDSVLLKRPWYPCEWKHAGGCDSFFERKWDNANKNFISDLWGIHYGHPGLNWFGRSSDYLDGSHPEKAQERKKMNISLMNDRVKYGGILQREKLTLQEVQNNKQKGNYGKE